jgi:hypothetical protein
VFFSGGRGGEGWVYWNTADHTTEFGILIMRTLTQNCDWKTYIVIVNLCLWWCCFWPWISACNPQSGKLPFLTTDKTVCLQTPGFSKTGWGSYRAGDNCTWFIQVDHILLLCFTIVLLHCLVCMSKIAIVFYLYKYESALIDPYWAFFWVESCQEFLVKCVRIVSYLTHLMATGLCLSPSPFFRLIVSDLKWLRTHNL